MGLTLKAALAETSHFGINELPGNANYLFDFLLEIFMCQVLISVSL
jgi:hypothetical protein